MMRAQDANFTDCKAAELSLPSACELVERLWSRELTASELVAGTLGRIERTQSTLNAFVTVCASEAMAAARHADDMAARGEWLGPLHGVPISVKDIINTGGVRTTWGSLNLADQIPNDDAVAVARLKAAGAIIIGKTTTSELAHKLLTDSPLTGVTRNPWDLTRTPGGSSGGSAVAVAAGLGSLSVATDAGASTRLPAACTGIVGMKPTLGLIPHDQVPDAFNNFIHLGVMARTVADAALLLDVLAGPDASDPHSLHAPPPEACLALRQPLKLQGLRVRWRPYCGNTQLASEIRARCEHVLGELVRAGAEVNEDTTTIDNAEPSWRILQQSHWAARLGARLDEIAHQLDPSLVAGVQAALAYTGQNLLQATYQRTRFFRLVQGWFRKAEYIVTPTMSRPPLAADHPAFAPIVIDGKAAGDMRAAWTPYLSLFDLTGHPAVSVPCGFTSDGLPAGLQIIAPWYGDADALRLAAHIENIIGWPVWVPPHANGPATVREGGSS